MDEHEEIENNELVERFKQMVYEGRKTYFDSEEMEIIIDELMRQFDLNMATEAIELAIQTFPTEYYFRILKVKKLILEFALDEAEKELIEIETNFPPSAELYLERVLLSRITGKEENALELLKKALILDPKNPEIHFSLTYEYIEERNIPDALFHIEVAMNEDDYFDEQLFAFSYLFEENQQYEEAMEFFSTLTELFPMSKGAWFGLALAYHWKDDYLNAIEANQFVLSIDENIATAYYNIGNIYYEMGNFEQALEYYEQSYNLDKEDYMSLNGIGDCYASQERFEDALTYYHKAFHLNPSAAITGILSVLKTLNKIDEAQLFVDNAFRMNPHSFDMLFSVLPFYQNEGQIEKLKLLFHSTLEEIDNTDDFFFYFTLYCLSNEFYELGIEIINDYLKDENLTDTTPYYLAALHYMNHQIDIGNRYLKIALLQNYEGYQDFLSLDSRLSSILDIAKLIDLYKPVRND